MLIPHGAVVRLRRALQGLLPRESASKEVDSACLSVIGYPAWAVEDPGLIERTSARIRRELGGAYGYKRFRRDGHQTVVEDVSRLHYEREELAKFEGIESEWPLFLAYELMTACCEQRWDDARQWRQRLEALQVDRDGQRLFPELYLVPTSCWPWNGATPAVSGGSRMRTFRCFGLAWLGEMLLEGLIEAEDLDPCGRRRQGALGSPAVLVALVPADAVVAQRLQDLGLPVSAPEHAGLQVLPSDALRERLEHVGADAARPHGAPTTET